MIVLAIKILLHKFSFCVNTAYSCDIHGDLAYICVDYHICCCQSRICDILHKLKIAVYLL